MSERFGTIAELVRRGDIVLGNALADAELQGPLAEHGYSLPRLQELDALRAAVKREVLAYEREQGEKVGATKARQEARDALLTVLSQDRKLARVALKRDPQGRAQLGLDETLVYSYAGLLAQARQFYNLALAGGELSQRLAGVGLSVAKLTEHAEALARLEQADRDYNKEATEAHEARASRDAALDQYADVLSDLLDIAEVALAGRPLLLGKLGLA